MTHGDARKGKWRENWWMEWVSSTLHTTSEHGVSSITTADAHTSAASSRLNWRSRRFKWTRPFRRKTKSDFCACAVTFQLASTSICYCHIELHIVAVASSSRVANRTTSHLLNIGFVVLWIWNKQYDTNKWYKLLTRPRSPWGCLRVVANEGKSGVPIRAERFCTSSPTPRRRHAKWRSHSCNNTATWW